MTNQINKQMVIQIVVCSKDNNRMLMLLNKYFQNALKYAFSSKWHIKDIIIRNKRK